MSTHKEVLNRLAKMAADAYLAKKSTPLQTSLQKIATQEDLSPSQIEYTTAEANRLVWASHFAKNKQAAYDFEPVDPKVVLASAQKAAPKQVKTASLDYALPPESATVSKTASFTGTYESGRMSDVPRRELKHTLKSRHEKLAAAREVALDSISVLQTQILAEEMKFLKEAKQMLLQTPFEGRGQALDKIAEFIRGTGHFELGKDLMAKLANLAKRQGLMKTADLKAPEEYISETLPAQVINGNHSLYITIDTLNKHKQKVLGYERQVEIVDSSLPELKEKIRAL